MVTKLEIQTQQMWDMLLATLFRLGCLKTEWTGTELAIYEPEPRALLFSDEHNLIIIAIDRNQLASGRGEEYFSQRKVLAMLKGCLGKVETIPENGTLYFRVQVEEPELVAA
jgi:hypothetical protein